MKIQGKVFVVTGGASGLGAATATYLVGQGAKVIMVDMNRDLGETLEQRLGEHAEFVMLDVTNEAAAEAFLRTVLSQEQG